MGTSKSTAIPSAGNCANPVNSSHNFYTLSSSRSSASPFCLLTALQVISWKVAEGTSKTHVWRTFGLESVKKVWFFKFSLAIIFLLSSGCAPIGKKKKATPNTPKKLLSQTFMCAELRKVKKIKIAPQEDNKKRVCILWKAPQTLGDARRKKGWNSELTCLDC